MTGRTQQGPEQPASHRVYGGVIFGLSVAASLLCTLGLFLALAFPGRSVLDPHYLFSAIWQGKSSRQVWEAAGGGFPGAHFWLRSLPAPDAIVQLGIVLAASSAGIAFIATAVAWFGRKRREPGWAILVLLDAAIILFAALGIIQVAA
jgi:hypothetical protein